MDYYTVRIPYIASLITDGLLYCTYSLPVLLPMDYYTVRIPYIASLITDGLLCCTYSLYRESYY